MKKNMNGQVTMDLNTYNELMVRANRIENALVVKKSGWNDGYEIRFDLEAVRDIVVEKYEALKVEGYELRKEFYDLSTTIAEEIKVEEPEKVAEAVEIVNDEDVVESIPEVLGEAEGHTEGVEEVVKEVPAEKPKRRGGRPKKVVDIQDEGIVDAIKEELSKVLTPEGKTEEKVESGIDVKAVHEKVKRIRAAAKK